jgi:uncharacterized protein (TIGR03083 family)
MRHGVPLGSVEPSSRRRSSHNAIARSEDVSTRLIRAAHSWFDAGVDATTLIDHLAADGVEVGEAAGRAGWDAPVPGCDWTVRAVVTHLGGVHRWAAEIVRTGSDTSDLPSAAQVGTGPADDELLDWFLAGHAELVVALGDAPADLEAVAFLPADSPLHFWARRQAHETAIHRVDVEGAAGSRVAFDADFAQDGIAEMLRGFARRRPKAAMPDSSIGLIASDGSSWLIRLGGERVESTQVDSASDAGAFVRGTSSELYQWLWNRPSGAVVAGDETPVEWWGENVKVNWG